MVPYGQRRSRPLFLPNLQPPTSTIQYYPSTSLLDLTVPASPTDHCRSRRRPRPPDSPPWPPSTLPAGFLFPVWANITIDTIHPYHAGGHHRTILSSPQPSIINHCTHTPIIHPLRSNTSNPLSPSPRGLHSLHASRLVSRRCSRPRGNWPIHSSCATPDTQDAPLLLLLFDLHFLRLVPSSISNILHSLHAALLLTILCDDTFSSRCAQSRSLLIASSVQPKSPGPPILQGLWFCRYVRRALFHFYFGQRHQSFPLQPPFPTLAHPTRPAHGRGIPYALLPLKCHRACAGSPAAFAAACWFLVSALPTGTETPSPLQCRRIDTLDDPTLVLQLTLWCNALIVVYRKLMRFTGYRIQLPVVDKSNLPLRLRKPPFQQPLLRANNAGSGYTHETLR